MNMFRSACTHVCWDCRKVTKLHSTCPHCGRPMVNMGKRWKPPRRHQRRRWREQQRLHETGYLPNGKADTWGGVYTICRWCDKRCDAQHEALIKAARPPNWYNHKISHSCKGEKRRISR